MDSADCFRRRINFPGSSGVTHGWGLTTIARLPRFARDLCLSAAPPSGRYVKIEVLTLYEAARVWEGRKRKIVSPKFSMEPRRVVCNAFPTPWRLRNYLHGEFAERTCWAVCLGQRRPGLQVVGVRAINPLPRIGHCRPDAVSCFQLVTQ